MVIFIVIFLITIFSIYFLFNLRYSVEFPFAKYAGYGPLVLYIILTTYGLEEDTKPKHASTYYGRKIHEEYDSLMKEVHQNSQSNSPSRRSFGGYGGVKLSYLLKEEYIVPCLSYSVDQTFNTKTLDNLKDHLIGQNLSLILSFSGRIHIKFYGENLRYPHNTLALIVQNNIIKSVEPEGNLLFNIEFPNDFDSNESDSNYQMKL